MCVAYSTLGNKEGAESDNAILMLIWQWKHFEMGTPLLIHENVSGFTSEALKDEALKRGYDHFQIKANPIDTGVHVGRSRKNLGDTSIESTGFLTSTLEHMHWEKMFILNISDYCVSRVGLQIGTWKVRCFLLKSFS